MMKRLANWLFVLAVIAGLGWWQRTTVVPFLVQHVPGSAAVLASVPGLAEAAAPPAANPKAAEAGRQHRGGAVPVVLAKAESKAVPVTIDAVGTVQSIASIAIRPRLDSQIATVDIAEGARVQKGDRLFTLDDRAVKAQLAQIDAQIEKDQAQIQQAQNDLRRAQDLLKTSAGSVVTRDTAVTTLKTAQAQLAVDQASHDAMDTQLSYTVITAPVTGRVGSIPMKPGAIVRAADAAPLATLNQMDPVQVAFSIPQTRLAELREAIAAGNVRVDVTQGKTTVSGTVDFIENAVDTTTGTVGVKAKVPNADEVLWPGAYVQAQVVIAPKGESITIPTAALQLGQQGPYVFAIKDGKTARLRQVSITRSSGPDTIVTSGLSLGEDVVVDGQLRLVDGAEVSIKPPANDTAANIPVPKG